MSKGWPSLLRRPGSGIADEDTAHLHDAEDIRGAFTNVSVRGTIYATAGEISSLTVIGTLTLSGAGKVVTAATGQRVELVATSGNDMLLFWTGSGDAGELPGHTYAVSVDPPTLAIGSPCDDAIPYPVNLTLVAGASYYDPCAVWRANLLPVDDGHWEVGSATKTWLAGYFHDLYDEGGVKRFDLSACKGQTFTPTLTAVTTNPTLGATGTAVGWYQRMGDLVNGWVKIAFGGAGANPGSGLYKIDLPVTASGNIPADTSGGCSIGSGRLYDDSGPDTWLVDAFLASTSNMRLRYDLQTGAGGVSHAAPFAWAAADYITVHFSYEAA